jgi:hypothetical protein
LNIRRFFAYVVLACWIGLTPVAILTGIQWSREQDAEQVLLQRSRDISGDLLRDGLPTTPDQTEQLGAQLRRSAKTKEQIDTEAVDALRAAEINRKELWWEFIAWTALTLLGSALLAEHKEKIHVD